jgi:signal transduction histidine kinase
MIKIIKSILQRFRGSSIRYKVPLVVMPLGVAALFIMFAAMIASEWIGMKRNIEKSLEIQAMIIGSNSSAALIFDDEKAATETLSSLSASPRIAAGILYDKNGKLFAKYIRNNIDRSLLLSVSGEGKYYRGDYLTVSRNVLLDNKIIGAISVTTDLHEFYSSLKMYIIYATIIMLFAFLGIILLSRLLQQLITEPILKLSSLMNVISYEKNYLLRAEKYADDEIGILVEGFNNMLSRIHDHEMELMKSGHLAAVGELAAGVAHEINNPINGIINYAQIIANKSEKGSKEYEIASRIIKEGDRIANIVSNLLLFSRQKKEERLRVSVHEIFHGALELIERSLQKDGIIIKAGISRELPEVVVNPQQIQQVFINIISNSRYALNKKYPQKHDDKILEISGDEIMVDNQQHIRILFYDHGIGISPVIINRVMEPFFTTKSRGEGTGLGLSISQNIINTHNGKLTIDSREGEFTKVELILPCNKH